MAQELSVSQEATDAVRRGPGRPPLTPAKALNSERYYLVRFNDKQHPNEPEKVVLSVNGETIQVTRAMDVVLPERFLECARNSYFHQFRQEPGEERKVVGKVMRYPFTIIREDADPDEFQRGYRQGTKELETRLAKQGIGRSEI